MKDRQRSFVGSLIVLSVLGTSGAAAEPFVYVTQYAGDSVTVIDAATTSIVATIPLEIVPGDGMTLYASVDGGGGVYKTTDGGATWTAVNDGLPIGSP